jgi:CBS domain-containing protein
LWEADCGAVPITDAEGRLVGIITDRDLCMASYTRGQPLWACTVASVMSKASHVCRPSDTVERVAEVMREHQVRRVPIVEPDGRLLGIVSLADLARFVHSSGATGRLSWFVDTVAAISSPHSAQHAATAAQ